MVSVEDVRRHRGNDGWYCGTFRLRISMKQEVYSLAYLLLKQWAMPKEPTPCLPEGHKGEAGGRKHIYKMDRGQGRLWEIESFFPQKWKVHVSQLCQAV